MFRKIFFFSLIFLLGLAISLTSTFSVRGSAQESAPVQSMSLDQQAVTQAYLSSIQQQGASSAIQVIQVAVVDQYALLEWAENDGGGDCLLQQDGQWRVVRGSGGSFSVGLLNEYLHVPLEIAQSLVQQLHPDSPSVPSNTL